MDEEEEEEEGEGKTGRKELATQYLLCVGASTSFQKPICVS